ncbi:hypothetical protein [Streptomyces acidiscabies]|uniref:hypothetical protein n=1 Tax=Streptomyces acidiscabies TaxID=42234 RepID=UPI000AE15F2E|nr:hypothetical protein [Streptomyces acidiscabies]
MNAQEAILKALSARVSPDGTVQVHRAVLAAEIGSSARTTDRGLKALREAGELEIVTGGRFGAPTIYRLTGDSAPTPGPQRAIHSAPQENTQVTQRATPLKVQRAMCTAGCRYPLDRIWIEQGIDMHPWCELGVTSSHATLAQLHAAVRQYAADERLTHYEKAA